MISLDKLGVNAGADQSSLKHNFLNTYEKIISNNYLPHCKIVIISNQNPYELAHIFSERFPHALISVHTYKKNIDERETIQLKQNVLFTHHLSLDNLLESFIHEMNIDFLIEDGSNLKSDKLSIFKNTFYNLNPNGIYFAEDLHASYIEKFIDNEGFDIIDFLQLMVKISTMPSLEGQIFTKDDIEFSKIIDSITFKGKLAIISKGVRTFKGLRDQEAVKLILENKISGNVLLNDLPSKTFTAKNVSIGHPEKFTYRHPSEFKIFTPYINVYRNANCKPGQVVWVDNYLIPDSFRMQHTKNLANRHITNYANTFHRVDTQTPNYKLIGDYLYLDSEFPSHFGHFTSEVISRLWAWNILKENHPELKVLLSVQPNKSLPSFVRKILNSFGILDSEICTFEGQVIVENLYTACPQYVIGSHIDPQINKTWDRISKGFSGGEAKIKGKKLFIARPTKGVRKCLNPEVLEDRFKENGFEFFNPENFSWEDQIRTFDQADTIAGYAGSGMFNAMFCSNIKNMIAIGADSYNAYNEHFICAIKNVNLYYIWGDSSIKHGKFWDAKAFSSDFTFNYERDEGFLLDVLRNFS